MNPTRIINFDLDGVLADFRKRFVEIAGQTPDTFTVDEMWARVASVPEFFLRLDVAADAMEMFALARTLGEVRILTAIPRKSTYPDAAEEKRRWVAQHFGEIPVTVVQYARQKADHARPGDVLVDDAADNVRRWIEAGGTGIVHVSAAQTMPLLLSALH
jgi:5'(3')-deoxyribonucleotidase